MVSSTAPSLLIADDDERWRSTVREIFEPNGYEVLTAGSGRETISIVEEQAVDCLLLDMHMPDLTGVETLRVVRQLRATLPCIFVTAETSQHLLRQALALRAYTVLTKPVSAGLMMVVVRRALESAIGPSERRW